MCLRQRRPEHSWDPLWALGLTPRRQMSAIKACLHCWWPRVGRSCHQHEMIVTQFFPGVHAATEMKDATHPFNTSQAQLVVHVQTHSAFLRNALPLGSLALWDHFLRYLCFSHRCSLDSFYLLSHVVQVLPRLISGLETPQTPLLV